MTWSLPTPDDRVEWSLWTSSNDSSSQALKSEFKETMTALGQHQYFTPYYQVRLGHVLVGVGVVGGGIIHRLIAHVIHICTIPQTQVYDGASYNCVNFPDHCGSLCTNHGRCVRTVEPACMHAWVRPIPVSPPQSHPHHIHRYCMPDPDKDPYHGYSGKDIVVENLRQKCIWNHYGGEAAGKQEGVGLAWWGYVREFHERCSKRGRFTDVGCVKEAMKASGVDFNRIQQCMDDAGGVDQVCAWVGWCGCGDSGVPFTD